MHGKSGSPGVPGRDGAKGDQRNPGKTEPQGPLVPWIPAGVNGKNGAKGEACSQGRSKKENKEREVQVESLGSRSDALQELERVCLKKLGRWKGQRFDQGERFVVFSNGNNAVKPKH